MLYLVYLIHTEIHTVKTTSCGFIKGYVWDYFLSYLWLQLHIKTFRHERGISARNRITIFFPKCWTIPSINHFCQKMNWIKLANWLQRDLTHLATDLLFDALLRLRQCRHRCHVGPAERPHHRLQDYISKQLLHVCEEHVKDSVPNLNAK